MDAHIITAAMTLVAWWKTLLCWAFQRSRFIGAKCVLYTGARASSFRGFPVFKKLIATSSKRETKTRLPLHSTHKQIIRRYRKQYKPSESPVSYFDNISIIFNEFKSTIILRYLRLFYWINFSRPVILSNWYYTFSFSFRYHVYYLIIVSLFIIII